MIKIENISKDFDKKQVLENLSFTLREGEITALIGENGAGKSTLLRLICGYLTPTSGQIFINDYNIACDRVNALSLIGYVPEVSSLYNDMTVYDFLVWIGKIWKSEHLLETILSAAKQMNILDVLPTLVGHLSKGYKKRVEIAAALMHQPSFLILDEPTDGLDPNQREEIRKFIRQYAKNKTILISTHVLEDVNIADRVIMLAHGHIINDSSLAEFKKFSLSQNLDDAFRIVSQKSGKNQ